jgi:phospholipase C
MTSWVRAAFVLCAAFLVLLFAAFLVPACSSTGTSLAPGADAGNGGDALDDVDAADVLEPPNIARTQTEAQLAPQRAACAFDKGAWPAQTIGTDYPIGTDIPINHVIMIMQENRSFDHYLGRLVAQGYYQPGDFTAGDMSVDGGIAGDAGPGSGFSNPSQLDAPPAGWSNTDVDGGVIVPHPDDEYCYGVNHSWGAMHDDFDDGKLDHFVTQNDPDGERTFFYEDDTVIPFYYALANTFSVADHYHCSVLSSTWPNRYFMMAATSFGIGDNSFCTIDTAATPVATIFSLLDEGGHTWMDYTDGPHQVQFFPYFGFIRSTLAHYGDIRCDLMGAIMNGTLPDVSYVMGDEVDEDSDEGPSDLPGIGGQLVENIIRTLFASPSWKDTAVFITYDENGGLADHVEPAPACPPDNYPPHDGNNNPLTPGSFNQTGFRVPFIVVSPYAKAHFASHITYDHTSVVRFIESRFGLPALTGRDANATPPMELFDFQSPPFVTPPSLTAHTTVPPAILTQCKQVYAPSCDGGTL